MDYTSPESDEAGDHEVKTAPLLTRDAYLSTGLFERPSQYGVLGAVISIQLVRFVIFVFVSSYLLPATRPDRNLRMIPDYTSIR